MTTIFSNNNIKDWGTNKIIEPILTKGEYIILEQFTNKELFSQSLVTTFLEGIEAIEGEACRKSIEKVGLEKMHEYFSADNIMFLQKFVQEKAKKELLRMTYQIGKNELNLKTEFFIDQILEIRTHYPFALAKKSKVTFKDYDQYMYGQAYQPTSLSQKTKLKIKKLLKNMVDYVENKILKEGKQKENKSLDYHEYHSLLPYAAISHGPHLDSWLGNPLNGINLWWAIAGVTEDNGVILYPEVFGKHIQSVTGGSYLAPGMTLPKPHTIAPEDGNMLIFNADILHGTQLNISDFTRVAITTRIAIPSRLNPSQLFFSKNSGKGLHIKDWHSSEDIAKEEFEQIIEFPRKDNLGLPNTDIHKPHIEKRTSISLSFDRLENTPIFICASDTITIGEKVLVNFQKESVIVLRSSEGLQAVSARCPHIGVNLIDGFHDNQHIYCPGHGVAFCLDDGSSKCDSLKLQVYKAYEQDGQIFLVKR